MEGLLKTLDCLFGCHHGNLSRVFTLDGRTYRVCCSCGAKVRLFAGEHVHWESRASEP